ncbi:MAG: LLM class F420-dependent oxidoreductase [Ilumatobacteraceae bacterium]
MTGVQHMFQYPEFHGSGGDMLDGGPVAELAVIAERSGWDGFAFTEHPAPSSKWLEAGGHQALDPFAALAHVAAVTTRLKLLTYLAVVPYRNPMMLAKAAATVDKLSGGRFILGAGTGYLKAEFFAVGVDLDERNELFDEALDVLPLHWAGTPFSYTGKHFSARDVIALPKPVQQPIPIWIGGNAKLTLRRVAERAQGWMPLLGLNSAAASTVRSPYLDSLAGLDERLTILRDLAGDRFADLDIVVSYNDATVYDTDRDVERHREALAGYEAAGASWIIVPGPQDPAPKSAEFLDAFAELYIRR